jgi:hypothetical protein
MRSWCSILSPVVISPVPILALALAAGCGGNDSTGPAQVSSVALVSGDQQAGIAGRALAAPLVAEANDAGGHPIAGVTLQFAVTAGGGQVEPAEATTDAQGQAAVTFTLGATPGGAQQVTVTAAGTDQSATFNATASAPPTAMNASAGSGQSALAGVAVAEAPAVRVVDAGGHPVGGVQVRFIVTRGGGTIEGGVKVTGADGVAAADAWTMGPTGVNVVEATADGESLTGEPATFVATTTPAGGLDIVVRFSGTATASQQIAFAEAEVRWESVITNDFSDALVNEPAGACGDGTPALNETLDDLLILASVQTIDGPGSILAQAGPCLLRDENGNGQIEVGDFPGVGVMQFDEADLDLVERNGVLGATVMHEMGHVLGFGVLWGFEGLLVDPSQPPANGNDPHFPDAATVAAFDAAGGTLYADGAKVPVENTGGPGTADLHWRESVFDHELMTGFVNVGPEPLSAITIASFAAEGYSVDPTAADPYTLPLAAARASGRRSGLALGRDIAPTPLRLLGRDGRVTRTIRP